MSQRSFSRAQERRAAATERRAALRRRRKRLALGAAVGASAIFAPGAQAATFEVNTLDDHGPDGCEPLTAEADCTLRDAVTDANNNPGADTVTFASGLSGTIRLDEGQIFVTTSSTYGPTTISGPGAGVISVSGDATDNGRTGDDSRIFCIGSDGCSNQNARGGGGGSGDVTISGLTLTEGRTDGSGGAILSHNGIDLTLNDLVITSSYANGSGGAVSADGLLTIARSRLSGNVANDVGGAVDTFTDEKYQALVKEGSEVSGNSANDGVGGGIAGRGRIELDASRITGLNTAQSGGGVAHVSYFSVFGKYGLDVDETTVSGNRATTRGGGVFTASLGGTDSEITRSTLSGNEVTRPPENEIERRGFGSSQGSVGGGLFVANGGGDFKLENSTVSGNTADSGGGVGISGGFFTFSQDEAEGADDDDEGNIDLRNSTIAANTARRDGGGVYISAYEEEGRNRGIIIGSRQAPTVPITSTIVADNTAAGAANDLDREDDVTTGGFDLSFSLLETTAGVPLTQTPEGSNVLGRDPQLGALADNGGPTQTKAPAQSSPAIDQGDAPARLRGDQRGQQRTVDNPPADNPSPGRDGTDIGAVEIARFEVPVIPPPPPPVLPTCFNVDATIQAVAGVPTVGTPGRDIISGTAGPDVIDGAGGDDIICGRGGADRITGGTGEDRLRGNGGGDNLQGQAGKDRLQGDNGNDTARGGDGNDKVSTGAGRDRLFGGDGADQLAGRSGPDRLFGGAGRDEVFGGSGPDRLFGNAGNDLLRGGAQGDRLDGGSGTDRLNPGAGRDVPERDQRG